MITTFTRFVQRYGIYSDRRPFHAFVKTQRRLGLVGTGGMIGLWVDYSRWGRAATIAAQDARDEHETQQDALI